MSGVEKFLLTYVLLVFGAVFVALFEQMA